MSDTEKLQGRVAELEDVLTTVLEEIEDMVDIQDGKDGTPRPNWAMRLASQIESALGVRR